MKTQCPLGRVCPEDNQHCMYCIPDSSPFQKVLVTIILALLLVIAMATSSCSPGPHWHVTKHDGMQKVSYMKQGWPADRTCSYYPQTPVKRSTWAKQHYWRKAK